MAGYRATQIRKPADDTEFEKNTVILFQDLLQDPNVHRVGTNGQGQDGVDVIGKRQRDANQLVGVQCKLKLGRSKLTATEVKDEVQKALNFSPPLREYFVIATSKNDTKLQQLALRMTQDLLKAGRQTLIEVWGWDTLLEQIDQSERAKEAFDPGFSPSIASQNQKLDALVAEQQVTSNQVAALAQSFNRHEDFADPPLPTEYADRELRNELSRVLRRRGFASANTPLELAGLAERALDGDLARGSGFIRAEVCDRAARANAVPETVQAARRFRDGARRADPSRDLFVANAVLLDADGDTEAALRELKTRQDAEARSALLITLIRRRGGEAALSYFRGERLKATDFTAVGAMNLILKRIEGGELEEALADITSLPEDYFAECPALHLRRAHLTLASILPSDQRTAIFQGLPLNPRILQLPSDPNAQEKIRSARNDLHDMITSLTEPDLQTLKEFLTEFELWLRLEDPTTSEAARNQLVAEVVDPTKTLQRVRLALAYDIPFNKEALQRHLAGRKEIGGWTQDERAAAFLIVYSGRDGEKLLDFISDNHDDLFAQSDLARGALAGIEIEVLARMGRFEDARHHVAIHTAGGDLTADQSTGINEIVTHIERGDEAESLRMRYETSRELPDLRVLVMALGARRDAKQLATYAPQLVRSTRAREDFTLALRALFHDDRYGDLLVLADEFPELLQLDDEFTSFKGWSLYRLGRVIEAYDVARALLTRRGAVSDRELAINTAIESGDWGYLAGILAREAERIDALTSRDLIRFARLALEIGSPYVNRFRDAALVKSPNDPQVNLSAYMLATERGQEYRGPHPHDWFQKAVALSSDDGPVQSISTREVLAQASDWHERTDKIEQMLWRAESPLFLVARALRRQLLDLSLGQALRNRNAADGRIKYPIFAFSGAQPAQTVPVERKVAFDVTALITLDYLGLLERALDTFERPIVAPSTLSFLFLDRQFLKLRQPSELAKAERIQKLIAPGRLKVISVSQGEAANKEIGRDLSTLLSVARTEGSIVVRSAPVPKLDTFLEEHADMRPYEADLTDTLSVLAFLRDQGKVDTETQKRAEAYLVRVDTGWGTPRAIVPASRLCLDDLAVTYLDFVGLLEPLTAAVAAVYVHPDTEEQVRQVIQHSVNVEELLEAIERIRAALHGSLATGRISTSGRRNERGTEPEDDDNMANPAMDLMSNLTDVDYVAVDDRCLTKLPTWTDPNGKSAVAVTSLDILSAMRGAGKIDDAEYWTARHKLRVAGFYAVPLETQELLHHLPFAPVADRKIRETPELRAVRENLAMIQIHKPFVAAEFPWLMKIRFAVYRAVEDLWAKASDMDRVEAEANWLLSILPDPRQWCLEPENDAAWAASKQQTAIHLGLMLVFVAGSRQRRGAYFDWLEKHLAKPLLNSYPEIWESSVEVLKIYIERLMEGVNTRNPEQHDAAYALLINPLPATVRNRLLTDEPFRIRLGLKTQFWFPLGSDLAVNARSLYDALRAAAAGRKTANLANRDGGTLRVALNRERGGLATLKIKKQNFAFSDVDLLGTSRRKRCDALDRAFSRTPLMPVEEERWSTIAKARPLTDPEFVELMTALGATPEALREHLRIPKELGPDTLIPDDQAYYDRLIAPFKGEFELKGYIRDDLGEARAALFRCHPKQALRRMAFAALWQPLIPFDLLSSLNAGDVSVLLEAEDPFSLLFGFELCRHLLPRDSAFADLGAAFLSKLLDEDKGSIRRCTLFSAVAIIATINLRPRAKASDAPLFWVRLAALSHAGVLTDALTRLSDPTEFLRWSAENFYPDYNWLGVIDRRDAPRWNPDWIDPDQVYSELVGRVGIALQMIPEAARPPAWVSAFDAALDRLHQSNRGLASLFPGPFDDFQEGAAPSWPPELFTAVEEKLRNAAALSEVPELFALVNSTLPSDSVLENIQRILNQPFQSVGTKDCPSLDYLRACAQMAGISRSVSVATAVINHCLFRVREAGSGDSVTDLFFVMAESCAAHGDPAEHRRLVGACAANICFATRDPEALAQLDVIFECLERRDERLMPSLARAKAINRVKRAAAKMPE